MAPTTTASTPPAASHSLIPIRAKVWHTKCAGVSSTKLAQEESWGAPKLKHSEKYVPTIIQVICLEFVSPYRYQ